MNMTSNAGTDPSGPAVPPERATPTTNSSVMGILLALSFCHLLNDAIQALLPAIYPLLKESFRLNFTQIGLITFTFQMVGSVLQPVVGFYTDKHPQPYSLAIGMSVTLVGVVLLALAPGYGAVLIAAALIGTGSAVFHPESSRMARLASGGRAGFAQSVFQVGGNFGTALGPFLAASVIVPRGQRHILWFTSLAALGIVILVRVGQWCREHSLRTARSGKPQQDIGSGLTPRQMSGSLAILMVLMFSKFFYLASMTNYYTFYLIHRFGVSVTAAQMYLFAFLAAVVVGTLGGGPLGDRLGRKPVIWVSILGIAPFALWMPYAGLGLTFMLSLFTGALMASAFPAILVYATELMPGRVGLIAGWFFGFAFGLAGIGAAVLGRLADATSIEFVMHACSFLPLLGLFTWFLPDVRKNRVGGERA